MTDRATDQEYLRYQYGGAEKLRVRMDAHARFSESQEDFFAWMLAHLQVQSGQTVVDVGCGTGAYNGVLSSLGARIVGLDTSPAMLHETRQQAQARGLNVTVIQATAEALPFSDAGCDRVMANHMLYHVPDQIRALQEMGRVLRPGGRVLLATNAADHMARLHELHCDAARALGFTPNARVVDRFTLDDLPLVQSVFPGSERHILPNAFIFPNADAALQHYATGMIDAISDPPADNSQRPRLLALMESRINAIVELEGVFRVPKNAGCFVATV
jgi:SAM-dependent methyltransferase